MSSSDEHKRRYKWTWVHHSAIHPRLYIVFGSLTGADMVELGRFYNVRIANLYAKQRRSGRLPPDRLASKGVTWPKQSPAECSQSTQPSESMTPNTGTESSSGQSADPTRTKS